MKKIETRLKLCAVILSVMTLLCVLSSCGSNSTTTVSADISVLTETHFNGLIVNNDENEKDKALRQALSDNMEAILSAERGYDFGNLPADQTEYPDLGCNLEYAYKYIEKAFTDAGVTLTVTKDVLTENDVECLIKAFATTVDVSESSGILNWVGTVLGWITNTLCGGSYVLGICLFAVIWEILLIYFSIRQQKNSIKQAKLRPKEIAIKNKYKGRTDQKTMQLQQQEIQEMYQRENFNPASGCLPLLLQMPILFALYYIVIDPLRYVMGQNADLSSTLLGFLNMSESAGGLGAGLTAANSRSTIEVLSFVKEHKDAVIEALKNYRLFTNGQDVADAIESIADKIPNFNIGSLNFGLSPSAVTTNASVWPLLFIPVIVFASYFCTTKLTRKFQPQPAMNEAIDKRQQACSNWMMDISMPLISAFFCWSFPAVIGVYWAFRSWIGIAKSFTLSRLMPLPVPTEEEIKQAEKEMAGKKPKAVKSENAGVKRSLHHIDDEDFDDTRERALELKAKREALESEENAKKPAGNILKETNSHKEKTEKTSENAETDKEEK